MIGVWYSIVTVQSNENKGKNMSNFLLRTKAIDATYHFIDIANGLYGLSIPHIPVTFNLRGTTAGQAWTGGKNGASIRYQPELMEQNEKDFFEDTIPHEVAHIVVHYLYPNSKVRRGTYNYRTGRTTYRRVVKPHGNEWKRVMRDFGVKPERCHTYDTGNVGQRKLAKAYTYKCACQTFQLTQIRHRRILQGKKYSCQKCRTVLQPA